jgi:hypothetical protein
MPPFCKHVGCKIIQGVSKKALQLWKLTYVYSEDIYSVLNCHNVAEHTVFYLGWLWLKRSGGVGCGQWGPLFHSTDLGNGCWEIGARLQGNEWVRRLAGSGCVPLGHLRLTAERGTVGACPDKRYRQLTKQLWVRLTQQFFSSSSDVIATKCFDHTIIIRRHTQQEATPQ